MNFKQWLVSKYYQITSANDIKETVHTLENGLPYKPFISEPTYMLAKAIDDGVVGVYETHTASYGYSISERTAITLTFPDKKVVKGTLYVSYHLDYLAGTKYDLYLPSFNSEELKYLLKPVLDSLERREAIKEAKKKSDQDAKDAIVRRQIMDSLGGNNV